MPDASTPVTMSPPHQTCQSIAPAGSDRGFPRCLRDLYPHATGKRAGDERAPVIREEDVRVGVDRVDGREAVEAVRVLSALGLLSVPAMLAAGIRRRVQRTTGGVVSRHSFVAWSQPSLPCESVKQPR